MKKNYNERFASFYSNCEWRNLRDLKFGEANGLCEKCLSKGIVKKGVEVHHKIPIEKDWSKRLDYDNLILLCKECHNEEHMRSGCLNDFLNKLEKGEI